MSEVTWKILAKEVDDKKTIEEEIDEDMKTHNEDPSAHKQSGEAIDAHRTAEILDHLDEAVRNAKLWKWARGFTAIVDPAGNGDYTDIQDAIDYVNGLGGGSVLVLPGTYNLTDNLVLYSNIDLIGFDKETTILDFGGNVKGVKAEGDTAAYITGTITATNNSYTITGSGTSWSGNIAAGEYIMINGIWYEIASVDGNTTLTLVNKYRGKTTSGLIYAVAALKKNIIISGLTIKNFGSPGGINFCYVINSRIENNYITNQGIYEGIYLKAVSNSFILFNTIDWVGEGIEVRSYSCTNLFLGNNCNNSAGPGIMLGVLSSDKSIINNSVISNNCNNCNVGIKFAYADFNHIANNDCNYCSAYGIQLIGSDHNTISNNSASYCFSCGIMVQWSDYNTITGNMAVNGTDGIDIYDSGCDKNIVTFNQVYGNSSDDIRDIGTATEIAHNIES